MDRPSTAFLRHLSLLFVLISGVVRAATGGPDTYGYTWVDSNEAGGPVFQWIDPTTGQTVITGNDDVSSIDLTNGIGSPVELGFPVTLYGQTFRELVPTTNGYLSSDPQEAGSDASNDCPLPATPDKGGGVRIYAFHDDLTLTGGGDVYYEYFESSPHPHEPGGVSIFTWNNVIEKGSGLPMSFQVLLFHSGDILIQFQAGNPGASADGYTIGMQDHVNGHGLSRTCGNGGLAIPSSYAVAFQPPVITVTTTADENDSPAGADVSLREAIRDIPAGGRIELGTAGPGFFISSALQIDKSLTIRSSPASDIMMTGSDRIFSVSDGGVESLVVMENLNLNNGRQVAPSGTEGGAINSEGFVHFSLREVDFFGNEAGERGGAIHMDTEQPSLRASIHLFRCRFGNNKAGQQGGAMHLLSGADISLDECEFYCNESAQGAAFWCAGNSLLAISRSAFFHNESGADGFDGFAVRVNSGTEVDLVNSTLSHNTNGAFFLGGPSSSARITHVTFVGNTFAQDAASSAVFNTSPLEAPVTVDHCIFSENRAGGTVKDVGPFIFSDGFNLSDANPSGLSGATEFTGVDPGLGPLGPNGGFAFSHLPLAGSLAIDLGEFSVPASFPSTDQRGLPRIENGDNAGGARRDVGAVEARPFVLVDTTVDENNGPGVGAGTSLREAVAAAGDHGHVRFDPALSGQTIDLTTGSLDVVDRHIDASNLAEPITIDALGTTRRLSGDDGFSLHQLRFVNGTAGALVMAADEGTLDRCTFEGNSTAGLGGGAVLASGFGSTLTVSRCRFIGNEANPGPGGGLYSSARLTLIDRSWFDRNTALSPGGGAFFATPHIIRDTTFSGNRASAGGGFNSSGIAKISGVTVSGNHGNVLGGGINFATSLGTLDHSTIVGNSCGAGLGGAGIYFSNTLSLEFCFGYNIIAKNRTTDTGETDNIQAGSPSPPVSLGFNLTDSAEPDFGHPNDLLDADPRLGTLGFQNGRVAPVHYPLLTSGAIDAGAQPYPGTLALDALGQVRVADGLLNGGGARIDIGAVEAAEPVIVTTLRDEFDTPSTAGSGDVSLREAIRDANDGDRIIIAIAPIIPSDDIIMFLDGIDNGQGTELQIDKSLLIDATGREQGLTIFGPAAGRCLNVVAGGHDVSLHGLSLANGTTTGNGGGLRCEGARLTMSRGSIFGNAATDGGGVLLNNAEALFENVTILDNDASDEGGAIFAFADSEFTLRHCSVWENESTSGGAGFHLPGSALTLFSSVIGENRNQNGSLFNSSAPGGGSVTSLGYNLTDGTFLSDPTDLASTAPLMSAVSFVNGRASLSVPQANSPAVDAGPPGFFAGRPCTDARGLRRIACGRIDIGAYELGGITNGEIGTDGDLDGMNDFWEAFFGLNPFINDANLDLDGDGRSNLSEFLAQTKPDDAASALQITNFITFGGASNPRLTWSAVPGVDYGVWVSEDLGVTDPWQLVRRAANGGSFENGGTEISLTLPTINTTNFDSLYFQVRSE